MPLKQSRVQLLQLLGLRPTATLQDIKSAHHRLAKKLHPDRPGGSPAAFRTMQDAYEKLLGAKASTQQPQDDDGWFSGTPESEWHPGPAHDNWTQEDYDLYEAVWDCNVERCLELLRAGARPDGYQNDVWGGTTLMLAAQHGNVKLVRALLAYGASPFAVDEGGITASKWARRRKRWDALKLIERRKEWLINEPVNSRFSRFSGFSRL